MSSLAIHENKIYSLGDSAVYTIPTPIFPNPTLWLRADAGVVKDGDDKVSQWQDQSGNDYHAEQGSQSLKPLLVDVGVNGKPVLRFDGSQSLLIYFPVTFTNPYTFFIVGKSDYSGSSNSWFFSGEGDFPALFQFASSNLRFNGGNGINYPKTSPWGDYYLYSINFNGGDSSAFENGIPIISGNLGTSSFSNLRIGARNNGAERLVGDISEIIIYNSPFSDPQRQSVENYLMAKYAL